MNLSRTDYANTTFTRLEPQQRERLNAAAASMFKDPDATIREYFPLDRREQAETQAFISHFLKEASAAENKGDDKAWLQATDNVHQARRELSSSRSMLYRSEAKKTAESRDQELFDALSKVNGFNPKIKQGFEKMDAQVKQEMDTSELSTQLAEAEATETNAWSQFKSTPLDPVRQFINAQDKLYEAINEKSKAKEAYDTASKAKSAHYIAEGNLFQLQKELAQAENTLDTIENDRYKKLVDADRKDNIRKSLNKLPPYKQEQFKQKFSQNSERFASALLLKYPKDVDVLEKIEQIRLENSHLLISRRKQLDTPGSPTYEPKGSDIYKEKSLEIDIDVLATKRKELEELSSRKWREMEEERLSPKAKADDADDAE